MKRTTPRTAKALLFFYALFAPTFAGDAHAATVNSIADIHSRVLGYYDSRHYGVVGSGSDVRAAFNTLANTTLPATGGTIALAGGSLGTYHIASTLTIPAKATLRFENGAVLRPASGVTVTIAGPIQAAPGQRIFDLSQGGIVNVTTPALQNAHPPEWWGAAGDGSTDDREEIQAAIDSAASNTEGGTVVFASNLGYGIGDTVDLPANVHLRGPGRQDLTGSETLIALSGFAGSVMVDATSPGPTYPNGNHIEGMTFDGKNIGSAGSLSGLTMTYRSNPRFVNNGFRNFQGHGLRLEDTNIPHLSNNFFLNNGSATQAQLEYDNCTSVTEESTYLGGGRSTAIGGIKVDRTSGYTKTSGTVETSDGGATAANGGGMIMLGSDPEACTADPNDCDGNDSVTIIGTQLENAKFADIVIGYGWTGTGDDQASALRHATFENLGITTSGSTTVRYGIRIHSADDLRIVSSSVGVLNLDGGVDLAEDLTATETDVTVTDAASLSLPGSFLVNSEQMDCVLASGNDLTCTRGTGGTTAATQNTGEAVVQVGEKIWRESAAKVRRLFVGKTGSLDTSVWVSTGGVRENGAHQSRDWNSDGLFNQYSRTGLTVNSTTPSVLGNSLFFTGNTATTAITSFRDAAPDSIFYLWVNDSNTKLVNGDGATAFSIRIPGFETGQTRNLISGEVLSFYVDSSYRIRLMENVPQNSVSFKNSTFTVSGPGTYTIDASAHIAANLPTAASSINRRFTFKKTDAQVYNVTITPNGAETIEGASTLVISRQNESVTITSNGTAWYVVGRDLPITAIGSGLSLSGGTLSSSVTPGPDWVDVTQAPYLVDNTGATDATADLQDVMDDIAQGTTVYFPAGTYRVDTTVDITGKTGFRMLADRGAIWQGAGTDIANLMIEDSRFFSVEGFEFDGGFTSGNIWTGNSGNYALLIGGESENFVIRNNVFRDVNDTAIVTRTRWASGTATENYARNAEISNNDFIYCKTGWNTNGGFRLANFHSNRFSNVACIAKVDGGLQESGWTLKTGIIAIHHNLGETMGISTGTPSGGVFEVEEDAYDVIVSENVIRDATAVSAMKITQGQTTPTGVGRISVIDNQFSNFRSIGSGGIDVGGRGIDMQFEPGSAATFGNILIRGNVFNNFGRSMIYLVNNANGTVNDLAIEGNQFFDWAQDATTTEGDTNVSPIRINPGGGTLNRLTLRGNRLIQTAAPARTTSYPIYFHGTGSVAGKTIVENNRISLFTAASRGPNFSSLITDLVFKNNTIVNGSAIFESALALIENNDFNGGNSSGQIVQGSAVATLRNNRFTRVGETSAVTLASTTATINTDVTNLFSGAYTNKYNNTGPGTLVTTNSATTVNLPTGMVEGTPYWDRTTLTPKWWNGSAWVAPLFSFTESDPLSLHTTGGTMSGDITMPASGRVGWTGGGYIEDTMSALLINSPVGKDVALFAGDDVTIDGTVIRIGSSSATLSIETPISGSATAGGGAAVPATVATFLVITHGGTTYKIPLFAN